MDIRYNLIKYIGFGVLGVGLLIASGCKDEDLINGSSSERNPDAITFSTNVAPAFAVTGTRAEDSPEYEPLVLTADGSQPLYLHTYEVGKIGYVPGEDSGDETRGMPVQNVDDLKNIHKNFRVLARKTQNGETYMHWTSASASTSDDAIWVTSGTTYWPAKDKLTFYAVAPGNSFSDLKNVVADGRTIDFDYAITPGNSDDDAVSQPDLLLSTAESTKSESDVGTVEMQFQHALSAVKFAVRDVMGGEIVNVKICGVKTQGHCTFSYESDGNHHIYWRDTDVDGDYSQDFNYAVADREVDPSDSSKDEILNDLMPEKTFMVIPQVVPEGAMIEVTLKRTGMTPEEITVRGRITSNNIKEWKPGYEYVYTISTSKSNWVYILQAAGNHHIASGEHNTENTFTTPATRAGAVNGDQIYVYSPSRIQHDTYGDNAYFNVRSFRYRANRPTQVENMKWTASHGDCDQYYPDYSNNSDVMVEGKSFKGNIWIKPAPALSGQGSSNASGEKINLQFEVHHQVTSWGGDAWMQEQAPYAGYEGGNGTDLSKIWDLSTCGGKLPRNTANAYVIDRGGWYCFPLVYGNSFKNGVENQDAYTYQGSKANTLKNLLGKSGPITAAKIPEGDCSKAEVVWADMYNAISDVKIITKDGFKMIAFHANSANMQQGNVVLGLYNSSGEIVWSWHIWVNEHWLDPKTGQPHVFNNQASAFAYEENPQSHWRQRGDLLVDNQYVDKDKGYYIAPYNVGWCDPKNVYYLRRPGEMKIVQYDPTGKPSGKTASLPILQDGEKVEYKYGNNTYYQWGRKDPIVGFVDHTSTEKRNFGPKSFKVIEGGAVTIDETIKNPNVLYCRYTYYVNNKYQDAKDWLSFSYENLWNNSASESDVIKTVYDPSPPGYMVPPTDLFKFCGPADLPDKNGNDNFNNDQSNNKLIKLNGEKEKKADGATDDEYTYRIYTVNKSSNPGRDKAVWLTSTGNRWFTSGHTGVIDKETGKVIKAGENFNPQLIYLWSSTTLTGSSNGNGYGLALGLDNYDENKNYLYIISSYFVGRKALARPIRPIREK